MKHTTLNNMVANSCAGYCRLKNCSLTVRQIKSKECLSKNCWHLVKYKHPWWDQREREKAKKKANRQIEKLLF